MGASRLTVITWSISSIVRSRYQPTLETPALLTSTSTGPSASTRSTSAGSALRSERSAAYDDAPTSAATASSASEPRATTATCAPRSRNARARAAPMPRDPPVTRTLRSLSCMIQTLVVRLRRLPPHRDMAGAVAGEGRAVPVGPPVRQVETGQPRHQVELGRPHVPAGHRDVPPAL